MQEEPRKHTVRFHTDMYRAIEKEALRRFPDVTRGRVHHYLEWLHKQWTRRWRREWEAAQKE